MSNTASPIASNSNLLADTVRIESIRVHQDARGLIFEPLAASEITAFRNVHVVITEPGAVRGNHRHIKGTEVATVLGPMTVCYRQAGQLQTVQLQAGEIKRFWFPPGVAHAFRNHGSVSSVLTAFNTEEHDPAVPDAVREVLIEA
jgi:dTDP-4-dehydrorhamnose 3,5-epimerase-like enzyme